MRCVECGATDEHRPGCSWATESFCAGCDDLQNQLDEAKSIIRGFLWMLDKNYLVRDIAEDHLSSFTRRATSLFLFLRRALESGEE